MDAIRPYWKSVVYVLITVLSAVQASLLGDGKVSDNEWVNVAIAGVTAAAVFTAPNVPGARYVKTVLAVLGAALTVLSSAIIGDGVSPDEWIQIILAGAGAVGVYAVKNRPLNTIGNDNLV